MKDKNIVPEIKFYTWTHDENHEKIHEIKESAKLNKIDLNYLGKHLKGFGGVYKKATLLYEEACKLDKDVIICAVDGFDVFFCAGPDEIRDKFLSLDCNCVISAEKQYSHQFSIYKRIYDNLASESPYKYLNSGQIIGYAGTIKKLYEPTLLSKMISYKIIQKLFTRLRRISIKAKHYLGLKNRPFFSYLYYFDQHHIGKAFVKNHHKLKLKLDYNTDIFWCTANEWYNLNEHFFIENDKIVNKHTKNSPLIIHVPGTRVHRKRFIKMYSLYKKLKLIKIK